MAYAEPADVAVRWGRTLSDEEKALILARLTDVERRIRRKIRDLDKKVAEGEILRDDVVQVEADAVLRLVRNPDGYIQESDGSYSYMLSQDAASGKLEILAEEWELLGYRRTGMFMLVPTLEKPR
ncbi:Gp19/Gp15/Gp42 family protein [Nocardia sp. IFM 10818]